MFSLLNKTSTFIPSVTMVAQPLTAFGRLPLSIFTQVYWAKAWYGYHAVPSCGTFWDFLSRPMSSRSNLDNKSTIVHFEFGSYDPIGKFLNTQQDMYTTCTKNVESWSNCILNCNISICLSYQLKKILKVSSWHVLSIFELRQ